MKDVRCKRRPHDIAVRAAASQERKKNAGQVESITGQASCSTPPVIFPGAGLCAHKLRLQCPPPRRDETTVADRPIERYPDRIGSGCFDAAPRALPHLSDVPQDALRAVLGAVSAAHPAFAPRLVRGTAIGRGRRRRRARGDRVQPQCGLWWSRPRALQSTPPFHMDGRATKAVAIIQETPCASQHCWPSFSSSQHRRRRLQAERPQSASEVVDRK